MSMPFFFVPHLGEKKILMDEDASKHMIYVLRKKKGDEVLLTDGKGKKARAHITDDNRKKVVLEVDSITADPGKFPKITVGISLIKNTSRFEWFLEKATEIGVSEIIPLICERTEKEKFRYERMQNIVLSAMLQSQQSWMPVLHEPKEFESVVSNNDHEKKYIAHCMDGEKTQLNKQVLNAGSSIILIGPEGDFSEGEIENALKHQWIPVNLGNTRLRTETAGMVASVLLVTNLQG